MGKKKLFIILSSGFLLSSPFTNLATVFAKENTINYTDISRLEKSHVTEQVSLRSLLLDESLIEDDLLEYIEKISITSNSINHIYIETPVDDTYQTYLKYNNQVVDKNVINDKNQYEFQNINKEETLELAIEDESTNISYVVKISALEDEEDLFHLEANISQSEIEKNEENEKEIQETPSDSDIIEEESEIEKEDSILNNEKVEDFQLEENIIVNEEDSQEMKFSKKYTEVTPFTITKRIAVQGVYTVQKGDTINLIAKDFSLSIPQLKGYNPTLTNVNALKIGEKLAISREGVESGLSAAEKARLYKANVSVFNSAAHFFEYLVPIAKELSNLPNEEQLYVSLMLAQAALESGYGKSGLSSPPYYNLTGIKGDYNGDYVKMWTQEYDPTYGVYYSVLANFKKYPSYYESLKSNADKMRYGTYWDSTLYSGVWLKNSPTYKDAVQAIHESPYATDPAYGSKLNNIISIYKLYDYDFDTILSSKKVNYLARINNSNNGIFTEPKGMRDALLVTSYLFNGEDVLVSEEAKTQNGTFLKLTLMKTGKIVGWINASDLTTYSTIQSSTKVNYWGNVRSSNDGIYTLPKGMFNSRLVTNYVYNNQDVIVVEQSITSHGTFLKIANANNKEIIGWIKEDSVSVYPSLEDSKDINYYSVVNKNNAGIYTIPQGMPGAILVTSYVYNYKEIQAVEELKTPTGSFIKIVNPATKKTIGWINKEGIAPETKVLSSKNISQTGKVKSQNTGIYTLPKGTGNAVLVTNYVYNNKEVKMVEESQTNNGTFYKIMNIQNGKIIGWISKNDLLLY